MKKLFLSTASFILLSCSIVMAQSDAKKDAINFGGNVNGSMVSIMQVIDYPVLLLSDKNEKILSYEFRIVPEEVQSAKTIKIEGANLSQEALNDLRELAGEKGKIFIGKVKTQKGDITLETPYQLELKFNQ